MTLSKHEKNRIFELEGDIESYRRNIKDYKKAMEALQKERDELIISNSKFIKENAKLKRKLGNVNDIYVILLYDSEGFSEIVQHYFTKKEKAVEWLESNGFKYIEDDEWLKTIGYSMDIHAEIQILLNSEGDE
ncbi:hypothetical protein [Staphylococcus felis]|uniref:Uncharacterized protein n=1 Tax=Staphylococcus felis TaxID=46127 RepID=A0ABS0QLT8_9STAP|nr:hypothetical protein [Staphylococcus felis]MBH9580069.1 hypothetical protein [Staphylococcus felis]REI05456.1 hypothetical protein DOS69_10160 [Staphylococcus felis]REI33641.1 hypothetical protein DOS82_05955 [Staphylococcus felis]